MEIDSLAHEIINPLNIIIGCAELSKMESISNPVSDNINEIIKQSLWCCQLLKAELEARQNSNYINLYFFLEDIIDDIGDHPLLKLNEFAFFYTDSALYFASVFTIFIFRHSSNQMLDPK